MPFGMAQASDLDTGTFEPSAYNLGRILAVHKELNDHLKAVGEKIQRLSREGDTRETQRLARVNEDRRNERDAAESVITTIRILRGTYDLGVLNESMSPHIKIGGHIHKAWFDEAIRRRQERWFDHSDLRCVVLDYRSSKRHLDQAEIDHTKIMRDSYTAWIAKASDDRSKIDRELTEKETQLNEQISFLKKEAKSARLLTFKYLIRHGLWDDLFANDEITLEHLTRWFPSEVTNTYAAEAYAQRARVKGGG